MRYFVDFINDRGDWIFASDHKNLGSAIMIAEVKEEAGYDTRIRHEGKIIRVGQGIKK